MRGVFVFFLLICCTTLTAKDSVIYKRQVAVWSLALTGGIGTHAVLYQSWYSQYPTSKFHWTDDRDEWLDMDKAGHFFGAFAIQRNITDAFRWAGYHNKKSTLLGAAFSLGFQIPIEYFDGRSSGWGASQSDLVADASGTLFAGLQNWFWGDIRIPMRFSFRGTPLARIRPNTLGSSVPESMLKDYNGQIYWLDFNWSRISQPPAWWPKWLGFSLGYGANGMLGGYSNKWVDADGKEQNYEYITRYRQFFISPSINLHYINTKKTWLQALIFVTDRVRIPMPTLELNKPEKLRFHWIYW